MKPLAMWWLWKQSTEVTMNIQLFTETVYALYDEGDEKGVALLAHEFPELYEQYAVAEGLIDEED